MCNNLTEALMENIIEITWMFDALMKSGEIKPWDMLIDEYCGSNGIKDQFYKIARDFEKKYPFDTTWEDTDLDYIEEIEKFAKEKLVEKFGSTELQENVKVIDLVKDAIYHYGTEEIKVKRDKDKTEMITVYVWFSPYGECVAEYNKCDIKVLKQQLTNIGISEDL